MHPDRATEQFDVDRETLVRQARATLLRTLRNADLDLRDKATARPVPEESAPRLSLFAR